MGGRERNKVREKEKENKGSDNTERVRERPDHSKNSDYYSETGGNIEGFK